MNLADISIKPKYVGKSEEKSTVHAVFHCERQAVKTIRSFFEDENRQHTEVNFPIHIIDKPIRRLCAHDTIEIFGKLTYQNFADLPLNGMRILMRCGALSALATIGGLVMIKNGDKSSLFGLTAGHQIDKIHPCNHRRLDDIEVDTDSSASDSSDYSEELDNDLGETWSIPTNQTPDERAFNQYKGKVMADSFQEDSLQTNYDWALLDVDIRRSIGPAWEGKEGSFSYFVERELALKQCFMQDMLPSFAQKFRPFTPSIDVDPGRPKTVSVLTCHGRQNGILRSDGSCVLVGRSEAFIDVFDFSPGPGSSITQ